MQETNLSVNDLIYPVFIVAGNNKKIAIDSMPNINRLSLDNLLKLAELVVNLGINALAIFPAIENDKKSLDAKEAYNPKGLVQQAVQLLKKEFPSSF